MKMETTKNSKDEKLLRKEKFNVEIIDVKKDRKEKDAGPFKIILEKDENKKTIMLEEIHKKFNTQYLIQLPLSDTSIEILTTLYNNIKDFESGLSFINMIYINDYNQNQDK